MKIIVVTVHDTKTSQQESITLRLDGADGDGKIRATVGEFLSTMLSPYRYKTGQWIKNNDPEPRN